MKIYIEKKDIRFSYLIEWLSKKHEIVDQIDISDCVVLDIKETQCPKNIKKNTLLISFNPIEHTRNFCLSQSEKFLLKNAYLTSLACVKNLELQGKRVVIYGNGRIANFLKQMIPESIVIARHPKLDELPITSIEYQNADVIINTIPAHLSIDINILKSDVKIIDLASYPYGFDHEECKQKMIDIELWSGLPGKYFPKEAAWLIYEEVIKCLEV